jgi:hypothetical protein
MAFFGPMLTGPKVTLGWATLRNSLQAYFGSTTPTLLEPHRIAAGWCGLSLILTAFKRLEVIEDEHDTAECLAWLSAIKLATVRRRCETLFSGRIRVIEGSGSSPSGRVGQPGMRRL